MVNRHTLRKYYSFFNYTWKNIMWTNEVEKTNGEIFK